MFHRNKGPSLLNYQIEVRIMGIWWTSILIFFSLPRCTMNCDSPASASSRISLRTDCNSKRCPVSFKYSWSLFRNCGNASHPKWSSQTDFQSLLSTKVDSKNLVIKEQMLATGSSYKVKVDVKSPNGSFGWAAYQFYTLVVPSGGKCKGTQLDKKDVGSWVKITCQGWRDGNLPLSYESIQELEDGELDMLSYGVWPNSTVYIPPSYKDVIRFKVAIVNVEGAAYTTEFSIKVFILWHLKISFKRFINDPVSSYCQIKNPSYVLSLPL